MTDMLNEIAEEKESAYYRYECQLQPKNVYLGRREIRRLEEDVAGVTDYYFKLRTGSVIGGLKVFIVDVESHLEVL